MIIGDPLSEMVKIVCVCLFLIPASICFYFLFLHWLLRVAHLQSPNVLRMLLMSKDAATW